MIYLVLPINYCSDDQIPVIKDCPLLTIKGYLHSGVQTSAKVSWVEPRVTDNSGVVSVTVTHQPGSAFDAGTTPVTYSAIDPSGNQATCSFDVSVVYIPGKLHL